MNATTPAQDQHEGRRSGAQRTYTLLGPDGQPYQSSTPGTLGVHRRESLYGRLDCRSAQRAIARGHYVRHRVFFADEAAAIAAGYRPCAACLPDTYARWKRTEKATRHHGPADEELAVDALLAQRADVGEECLGAARAVGADQDRVPVPVVIRQLGQGGVEHRDVVGRGIRAGVPPPQQGGEELVGVVQKRQQREVAARSSVN
jgi:hypothetical protein